MLADKKIIYCPDYVINAGGLINVYDEMMGIDEEISLARVKGIADTLMAVFKISDSENITTLEASRLLSRSVQIKRSS